MNGLSQFVDGVKRQTTVNRGWRNFTQDLEDPSIYWEHAKTNDWRTMNENGFQPRKNALNGTPFSKQEIDELSAQGWQCIVMEWVDGDEWRNPGDQVVRLQWD